MKHHNTSDSFLRNTISSQVANVRRSLRVDQHFNLAAFGTYLTLKPWQSCWDSSKNIACTHLKLLKCLWGHGARPIQQIDALACQELLRQALTEDGDHVDNLSCHFLKTPAVDGLRVIAKMCCACQLSMVASLQGNRSEVLEFLLIAYKRKRAACTRHSEDIEAGRRFVQWRQWCTR